MGNGILKIAIADASKLGLMKNLKTMTQMEPELYAASISDISNFVERLNKNNAQKISDKNVKLEKLEKDIDEIIEVGSEVIVFGNKLTASEFAKTANSISYEIITAISQRVKRVFL